MILEIKSKNKTLSVLIDDEDYHIIEGKTLHVSNGGYLIVEKTTNKERQRFTFHRKLISPPDGMDVDHINRNRLDNRKANLRIVTRRQNIVNSKIKINSFSGYKGVAFHGPTKKYVAKVRDGKKRITGKYHRCPTVAALECDRICRKINGDFGTYNFPRTGERSCIC